MAISAKIKQESRYIDHGNSKIIVTKHITRWLNDFFCDKLIDLRPAMSRLYSRSDIEHEGLMDFR